jgi:RHS repeat-associated protein
MVYGPGGGRVIRTDPTGATLYLPGQELRAAGGTLTATRYYTDGGGATVAHRTPAGLTWPAADAQGSAQLAITTSGGVSRQYYLPYGGLRGGTDQLPGTDHGYVGGTDDPTTGLELLGARYYDRTTGSFISVDPLMTITDLGSINGYLYAGGNPTSSSDPTGLTQLIDGGGGGGSDWGGGGSWVDYCDWDNSGWGWLADGSAPLELNPSERVSPWAGSSLSRVTTHDEIMYRVVGWWGRPDRTMDHSHKANFLHSRSARVGVAP